MNPYEGMVIERPLYESLLLLDLTDKLENQCTHYWSTVQHVQHEKDRSHLVSVFHVSALQKALDAAHWVLTILSALKRVKSLPAKSVPVFSVVSLSLLDFVNFNKCVWLYWCFWREVWVCPYVRERERECESALWNAVELMLLIIRDSKPSPGVPNHRSVDHLVADRGERKKKDNYLKLKNGRILS